MTTASPLIDSPGVTPPGAPATECGTGPRWGRDTGTGESEALRSAPAQPPDTSTPLTSQLWSGGQCNETTPSRVMWVGQNPPAPGKRASAGGHGSANHAPLHVQNVCAILDLVNDRTPRPTRGHPVSGPRFSPSSLRAAGAPHRRLTLFALNHVAWRTGNDAARLGAHRGFDARQVLLVKLDVPLDLLGQCRLPVYFTDRAAIPIAQRKIHQE